MTCSTHRTAANKRNSTTKFDQSRSLNGENAVTNEGNGPTFGYSLASSRGNVAAKKGNTPKFEDSINSSEGLTTTKIGNGSTFGDGIALSRINAATNQGKNLSWAQIARGSGGSSELA